MILSHCTRDASNFSVNRVDASRYRAASLSKDLTDRTMLILDLPVHLPFATFNSSLKKRCFILPTCHTTSTQFCLIDKYKFYKLSERLKKCNECQRIALTYLKK